MKESTKPGIVVGSWATPYRGEIPKSAVVRKPGVPMLGTLFALLGTGLTYGGIEAILSGILSGSTETITEGDYLVLPFGLFSLYLGIGSLWDYHKARRAYGGKNAAT